MKKVLPLLLLILTSNLTVAQFIKEKSINAKIGYATSLPDTSNDDIADGGFFIQGELVLKVHSWFEIRPYAGLVWTESNGKDLNDNPTQEKAETKAFLLGGKVRLRAPIPYVAPYMELGLGASIGKFQTFAGYSNIDKSGVIYHIPFSFGLELGRDHNIDFGMAFYFEPSVEQFVGIIAFGVTIPLND